MDSKTLDFDLITKLFLSKTQIPIITEYLNSNINQLVSEESQQKLLNVTIGHNLMKTYLLSLKYRRLFLKTVIQMLENREINVWETLSISYANLLTESDSYGNHFNLNYLSYILTDGQTISLQESDNLVIDGTTGLRSWTAAKHLAKFFEDNKQFVENKSVLELGSGIGLTGIYILKTCFPSFFAFSDHHSVVLKVLQNNIDINKVQQKSCVYEIDWNRSETIDEYLKDNDPDVIIGTDIVFDPIVTNSLCKVINKLLINSNKTRVCFICCTHRSDDTIEQFRHLTQNQFNLNLKQIYFYDQTNDLKSFCYDSLNTKCSIFQINSDN